MSEGATRTMTVEAQGRFGGLGPNPRNRCTHTENGNAEKARCNTDTEPPRPWGQLLRLGVTL